MAQGLGRDKALAICSITKDQFYHRPKGKKQGRKPSRYTFRQTSEGRHSIKNSEVVEHIRQHLSDELNKEGYQRMTAQLQLDGYEINHKKVYRLMKANQLLRPKRACKAKTYVQYRIVCPEGPLRLMEMDIKYVKVGGVGRNAYILTVIDVFTRVVLYWAVGWHMKQNDVAEAWRTIIEAHLEPNKMHGWQLNIEVRSDNGPQFSAKKVRSFLEENYLMQTFTHPYTPQENGHVESFHAIIGDWLDSRHFDSMEALEKELGIFYEHYNTKRVHGSTAKLPPNLFWEQWKKGNIERIVLCEKKRKVRFKLKVSRQEIGMATPQAV